ncbi:MAG TPA: cation acetate symporter [Solirubrobacteraceae bacterium]|nr:cation acetate symporter [Solirubrobacteraceae bacterium]
MIVALVAVGAVTLGTLGLGTWGMRFARTTSDLLVASRTVTPWWNAAAISGEYLSAASFLGIAGLEMQIGASALWQSLGFTAGYLALLLFVAAPLRRYGSYTIPDFAEARLHSPGLRLLAAAIVLVIGGFYLVPQLKGAGLALNVVVGSPYWVGVVVVAVIVAVNVAVGGMRGITYVQAFQFWVKVFAIAVPAIVLLIHFGGLPERAALFGRSLPHAGRAGFTVDLPSRQRVQFPEAGSFIVHGRRVHVAAGGWVTLPANTAVRIPPYGVVPVASGTVPLRGETWARPVGGTGRGGPVLVYSLLIATFLGTMGLPHVLVRFYTNPDGHAARRTTVRVLGLLSLFYLFPAIYGALGRVLTPQLYTTGQTDDVVLTLPHTAWPGAAGTVLTAITCAGAFAAFLSTSSGLLVSLAGTFSHDVWPRLRHTVPSRVALRRLHFRLAALGGMVIPSLLALVARGVDISILVGWAFALAASSFCPMFLLGIWWTRLTARGAAAGMCVGTLIATSAIFVGLALGEPTNGALALLQQPAIGSVPAAFLTMIAVSVRDPHRVPDVESEMLALHAPEGLGLRLADEEVEGALA